MFPELKTRSKIRLNEYAVIPTEGRVINVIPGIENCELTIVGSPQLTCPFVQLVGLVKPDGHTSRPYAAEENVESFIYVIDGAGKLKVTVEEETQELVEGGYVYAPPGAGLQFSNDTDQPVRVLIYKQKYQPAEGCAPYRVFGNVNHSDYIQYMDLPGIWVKDLLPTDINFDMNFHVLSFEPGRCHPFIETHQQNHGAYVLEGQGIYLLGEDWIQIMPEDFIYFAPFQQQCSYAVGDSYMGEKMPNFTYIYSKDCNRDPIL
ncbi:hypothetical protein MACH09_19710 [Vibrio sp. MACH09]|uniref:(S)-ureidoglycine aminohydrolase n=1 Tax=unclassified Vibrio TaxID=2614977 RepID=UPI0014933D24|nr:MULTISPECIES: (S)-ureidoglycine aminohydrolase [unclassified Vibrio]NOI65646.1 cupin domain-containing protein [Vibrio sp. 99-8-1]GLO61463.1 hypothetical protein MACH09_19710 [Vibrio sp. MACH09]